MPYTSNIMPICQTNPLINLINAGCRVEHHVANSTTNYLTPTPFHCYTLQNLGAISQSNICSTFISAIQLCSIKNLQTISCLQTMQLSFLIKVFTYLSSANPNMHLASFLRWAWLLLVTRCISLIKTH